MMLFFWVVTSGRLVGRYQGFSPEDWESMFLRMFVSTYESARRHNPEERHCEELKSHIIDYLLFFLESVAEYTGISEYFSEHNFAWYFPSLHNRPSPHHPNLSYLEMCFKIYKFMYTYFPLSKKTFCDCIEYTVTNTQRKG
jgi:hypothetical protein